MNIAFIGFGEAGKAFTQGLRMEDETISITAFDIKTLSHDASIKAAKQKDYQNYNVQAGANAQSLSKNVEAIFSLVTADQAENAALEVAKTDLNQCLFLDCNSCAPETKRRSARYIEDANGRYVDVAIMTPVHPNLHKSPCLLAGPHAKSAHDVMQKLDMNTQIAGENIGDASMRKMLRSIMIKGFEALTVECFLAARKAGMETDILQSLIKNFTDFDFSTKAPYMIERVMTHGIRRASEMEEVAKTIRDLGMEPYCTQATISHQREIGKMALNADEIGMSNLSALCDAILAAQQDALSFKGEENDH